MKKLIYLICAALILCTALPAIAEQTNVSQGKGYTLVTEASSAYPDTEAYKLTDGKRGVPVASGENSYYYRSDAYVGFNQSAADDNGNFVIILDLGEPTADLSSFSVSWLNETDIGIFAPSAIKISSAETRNGSYTPLASVNLNEPTDAGISASGTTTLIAETPTEAQFVKYEITHSGGYTDESGVEHAAGWLFLDELTALTGATDTTSEISEPETSDPAPQLSTPQTGDGNDVLIYGTVALSALLALWALIKNRKKVR